MQTILSFVTISVFNTKKYNSNLAGKNVRSGRLPKIIGLDPASVLFSVEKPHERLNSSDATYVETIQTSKLGFFDPIGLVSFFPNGGRFQPGCSWDRVSWSILRIQLSTIGMTCLSCDILHYFHIMISKPKYQRDLKNF